MIRRLGQRGSVLVGLAAFGVAAGNAGCSSGARIAKENDRLRLEREALSDRVDSLKSQNAELRARVAELTREVDADASAMLPRVASLSLDVDVLDRGEQQVLRAKVTPRDGRNRFVQAVGSLRADVVRVDADGSSSVEVSASLDPNALRNSYRSGFGGSGYVVEFTVNVPDDAEPGFSRLVRVSFDDAITGLVHEAEALAD
ncbi:MAG: hypothetical protein AAGG07_09795 [Planctomycetota bacterium]